jgi:hypothetical protein
MFVLLTLLLTNISKLINEIELVIINCNQKAVVTVTSDSTWIQLGRISRRVFCQLTDSLADNALSWKNNDRSLKWPAYPAAR